MKSDADVVYSPKEGKLNLNTSDDEKRMVKKKVGGLIAWFKGKPELSSEQFEGMVEFNAVSGDHDHEQAVTPKSRLLLIEKHCLIQKKLTCWWTSR